MIFRSLGSDRLQVSAIGLGCMGMSDAYGPADEARSKQTVRAALDAGVNLLDTADFYGTGHNEMILADVLSGRDREQVVLSVKFGALRDPHGQFLGFDGRPEATKNFLAYSLRRLGTDYVDVYRPARLDPTVPVEETIGAIAEMVQAGFVRHIGVSEVGAETLRRAVSVHPIVDVQLEYSLLSRGIEVEMLPACRQLGVGVTAFAPLSHGLLSGRWSRGRSLTPADMRGYAPRFRPENLERNLALVEALRAVAERKGVGVAPLAIAWVLSRGEDVVPLVGARDPRHLADALGALDIELTAEDLSDIERAVPPGAAAGERYDEGQLVGLDSERRAGV